MCFCAFLGVLCFILLDSWCGGGEGGGEGEGEGEEEEEEEMRWDRI